MNRVASTLCSSAAALVAIALVGIAPAGHANEVNDRLALSMAEGREALASGRFAQAVKRFSEATDGYATSGRPDLQASAELRLAESQKALYSG